MPWTKKRLGDAFNLDVSTNTLSRADLSQTGTVQDIHYGDVLIKFGSVLDVANEDVPFVADCKFKCDRKNRLLDGDIIMADTAEDETAGKVTEVRGIGDKPIVSGLHTIVLRPYDKYGEGFLGYCLNASAYHSSLVSLMQGSKVFSISKGALDGTEFCYPSLPEQRRIGSLFRSLDVLIAGREKALGKLEALKKSMLLKMFPQGDATVPEIRFKGFGGDVSRAEAQRRREGGRLSTTAGNAAAARGDTRPPMPWKRYSFDEVFTHIPSEAFQIQSTDYRDNGLFPVVDQGKVRIIGYTDNADKVFRAKANPVIVFGDHTREVKFVDFDFVVGADGTQLLRTPNNDIQFMSYVVQSAPLPNMGYSRHFKFLQEATFLLPSLPEQRRIGSLFRSLDALIAARREEVEKLREMKKALLERMFA